MQKNFQNATQKLDEFLQTSQNKSYFVAFITFLFFFIFMIFGVIPSYNSVFAKIEDNARIETEYANAVKKLQTFQDMNTELKSNQNIFDFFHKIFPEEDNQQAILNDLGVRVKNAKLSVISIQFPEKYTRSVPAALNFPGIMAQMRINFVSLTLAGNRDQMLTLIKDIEKSARIYNIVNVSILRKSEEEIKEDPAKNEFNLQLDMEYFYFDKTVSIEN